MTRKEQAVEYFMQGYNCAQATALAFADLLPMEKEDLLKVCAPFGGGMGRLREVCGSFSASLMVLGALYGYDTPETGEIKAELYRKVQELAEEFSQENDSIICREILKKPAGAEDYHPDPRTAEYYKTRPCVRVVANTAEVLEKFLAEYPVD